MECSINNPALLLLMKHLVIGQNQEAPDFSAFHRSAPGSLVSIGQHFVTMNINTKIKIKADLNTESDQDMWAVHSCNSWLEDKVIPNLKSCQTSTLGQIAPERDIKCTV